MNKKVVITIGVLVVVAVAAVLWMLRDDGANNTADSSNGTNTSAPAEDTPSQATEPTAQKVTIIYTDSGYSPSSVTAKSGDTVVIKNDSSRSMQLDSDPHPAHTTNPELNVGSVPSGESMSFVVGTKGTFGYHNHLNPIQKGTIIVE